MDRIEIKLSSELNLINFNFFSFNEVNEPHKVKKHSLHYSFRIILRSVILTVHFTANIKINHLMDEVDRSGFSLINNPIGLLVKQGFK